MLDLLTGVLLFFVILALIEPTIKIIQVIYELILKCISAPIDLKSKYGDWAVITGSTDGIGKEYAKELAKRQINIVLISRSLEKLNKTKQEIEAINSTIEVKIIQVDFSKGKNELKSIMPKLNNIPVGILVNNVGKLNEYPMYLEEIAEDELWDIINVNISSTTIMTRMFIEQMKKRGRGAIVNISSASNIAAIPLMTVYSASKIFIKYFSDGIREEYSKSGITVQCLSPFYINTSMIGYSERIQNIPIVPDAAKYAKSAVKTLGKSDSTTGYWIHDILTFLSLLFPYCVRVKTGFLINHIERNAYLANHKKFCTQ